MLEFKDRIISDELIRETPKQLISDLLANYEWFTTARVVREYQNSTQDPRLEMVRSSRGISSLSSENIDLSALMTVTKEDVIDKFLNDGNFKIIADDSLPEREIVIEPALEDEDDIVSEALAEIYYSQGLFKQSIDIYRKLSLLNPEKITYFARIIDKIENK